MLVTTVTITIFLSVSSLPAVRPFQLPVQSPLLSKEPRGRLKAREGEMVQLDVHLCPFPEAGHSDLPSRVTLSPLLVLRTTHVPKKFQARGLL